ncbi:hypothetical protein RND81_12G155700 [Saponaria officinalis]|uniref:Transcription repressor n=1 Tax=Saponaria officinalis TaxID=3572 RepID=A0AAW1HB59_SAPOF
MFISNTTEDFSFPVITNPLTNFTSSSSTSTSSLWRISSKVYHHSEDEPKENVDNEIEDEGEDYRMEIRSMCEEILPSVRRDFLECSSFRRVDNDLSVEERMDFLWQNFNEDDEDEEERRGNVVVRSSKQVCVMQRTEFGRRHQSTLIVIGKLLKSLVSLRKSSHLRILKPRF